MDIIYHGKSHDIFFRGKLYNRRQELTVADPMSQADFEALTRKDASTLYTVIYSGVPSNTIKKFIGNDEVNIITEVTCTATEYEALNPPDPYTLYTVSYTNGTKIFLGKKEVGMSNLEYVSCTQSEYDELVSNEEINDYTIYTIIDDNDNPTGKKYFGLLQLIRLETLTKSEYDQLQVKDMNCFYTVTDGGTTKQYLGDLEIGAQMQKIEITQSAYDALTAYDNNTVYVVIDENNNYDVYFRGTMISQNRIREVTLTSNEYEGLETYDSRILYILSDTNERYLGDQKIGGSSMALIEKTITENGTYNARDDSVDGYSRVTVNVNPTSIELPANLMNYGPGVTDLDYGFVVINSSGTIESGTYTIDGNEYSGLRLSGAATIATPDNMSVGTLRAKVLVTGFNTSSDQRIFSPKRGNNNNWRLSVWSLSSDDRLRYNLGNCEVLDNSLVNLGYSVDYADPNLTKDSVLNKELTIEIRNDNTGYRTLYVNGVAKARKWTEGSSYSYDGVWNSFAIGGNGTTGNDILITEFKWIIA